MTHTDHSKFVYANYSAIQDAINSNRLDRNDIIICEDTKELILVKNDYNLLAIKSRTYRYSSIEQAITELNQNKDTYPGQLVAIMNKVGVYQGYLVNATSTGRYTVNPISVDGDTKIDYDQLVNTPIINIHGKIFEPIVLSELDDGFYKVNGSYKILSTDETTYSSASGNIFIVETKGNITRVKKVSTAEICDYVIKDGEYNSYVVPTTEWLDAQGYITEPYVDAKLEALEYITTADAKAYITEILETEIYGLVTKVVERSIEENFTSAKEEDIVYLFTRKEE